MSTRTIRKYSCPGCGSQLDGHTHLDEEDVLPSPGDIGICLYCATWFQFDESGFVIKISEEDLEQLRRENPNINRAELAVRQVMEGR